MNNHYFDDEFSAAEPDRFLLIASFIGVAQRLSFSEAANEQGTNASTLSRRISRLEHSLGVRLLNRTTRRVSLTEPGQVYYERCLKILDELAKADVVVSSYNATPRGNLRITVPVAYGRLHMGEVFQTFLEKYKEVQLEVNYTDRFVDLVAERYDIAVRTGDMHDSSLIAKKLITNHRVVVASPDYVRRHGVPKTPDDLFKHNCIRNSTYAGKTWDFARDGEVRHMSVTGNIVIDNSEAVCEAAARGCGIGLVAQYICADLLRDGRLQVLLEDWTVMHSVGIYIAYSSSDLLAPKLRAFIDHMSQATRQVDLGVGA